jgi:4-amino-4-deoxy-L-arabinose transferase-like glycosyltransferase
VPLLSAEIFFEFLLLASILLLMRGTAIADLAAGVVLGVATLTKTQTVLLPAFLFLSFAVISYRTVAWRRWARSLASVYVALLLVVAPWSYRNWTVFDTFVPVSTNGGWTLLSGNNPEARGDYTPETVLAEGYSFNPAQQIAMDRLARDRAIEWILTNPERFALLMPLKVFRLWAPDGEAEWFYQRGSGEFYQTYSLAFRTVRVVNQVFYLAVMILVFPALWLIWKDRKAHGPWAFAGVTICLFFTLISIVFSGQSRFHFSLMPFLIGYAAWALVRLGEARSDFKPALSS